VYARGVEAVPLLATFVGLVYLTWRRHRRAPRLGAGIGVLDNFDVDAAVAIHVAHREATERAMPVSPIHLLYGLLQTEAFAAALGDRAAATEARVHAALADKPADLALGIQVESHTSLAAKHDHRPATIADLWFRLARTSAATFVPDAHALLFALVHRLPEPPAAHADPEVHVVIRNDDYTPMRFVSYVVHAMFERSPEDAVAIMHTAHQQGRAIVGRFATPRAVELVTAARAKARESGYPLWLELEPW
jgi:ATP-dependent Clp protease adaptor protein ClpS